MADLTTDRQGRAPALHEVRHDFPVAADTFIGLGWLVGFDADGNLVPAADDADLAGKPIYQALEQCDNSGGAAGAKRCMCLVEGVIVCDNAGTNAVAAANRGEAVHVVSNHEAATTSTNSVTFGSFLGFTGTELKIKI